LIFFVIHDTVDLRPWFKAFKFQPPHVLELIRTTHIVFVATLAGLIAKLTSVLICRHNCFVKIVKI